MQRKIVPLVLAVFAAVVGSFELPSEITLCKKTNLDCMKTAFTQVLQVFAQGKKEFGVPKLDPLLMTKIHIPGNGGSIDLEQTYTDTHLHGLSTLVPKKITLKISDTEYLFGIDVHADDLEMIGTYTAKGKMLLFNVNGGGASNLTMKNLDCFLGVHAEIYDKEGRTHLQVKNFELSISNVKLILDYKNLINNNPELSQTVLDAMNESSDDVFKFLKNDYEHVIAEAFKGVANAIFSAVPLDKLFLD